MDREIVGSRMDVKALYEEFTFPLLGTHGNFMDKYIFPHVPGYPNRILDAGCGTGNLTVELANKFPSSRIVGIDFSENSLTQARMLARKRKITNVDFRCHDLMKEFHLDEHDGLYDFGISIGCLLCTPDPGVCLRHLRQLITKDGLFIIMVYGKYGRIETELRRDLITFLREVTGSSNRELLRLCQQIVAEPVLIQNSYQAPRLRMDAAWLLAGKNPFRFGWMLARAGLSKLRPRPCAAPSDIGMADQYLHPLVQNWTAMQWIEAIQSNGFTMDHFIYDPYPRGQCMPLGPLEKINSPEIRTLLEHMTSSQRYEAFNLIFRPPMNIFACKAV